MKQLLFIVGISLVFAAGCHKNDDSTDSKSGMMKPANKDKKKS